MTSRTSARFRLAFGRLPARVQSRARAAYRLFRKEPFHPSLRFKLVHPAYRALGVRDGDEIIWFWIGSHADYDRLLTELALR